MHRQGFKGLKSYVLSHWLFFGIMVFFYDYCIYCINLYNSVDLCYVLEINLIEIKIMNIVLVYTLHTYCCFTENSALTFNYQNINIFHKLN